jgi:hypothetical protein
MMRFRFFLQAAMIAGFAGPALSAEPAISVTPVRTEKGDVMHVKTSIRISASPQAVWAILSDCARAAAHAPS